MATPRAARPPAVVAPAPLPALALALVAALAVAGVAGALGFRLPGLEIIRVESLPPIEGAIEPRLARARGRRDGHRARRGCSPRPRCRQPDAAYVLGAGDREIVTLAWRAAGGEPAIPTSNLSLVAMAIPGILDEILVTKLLDRGSDGRGRHASTASGAGGSRAPRTSCS